MGADIAGADSTARRRVVALAEDVGLDHLGVGDHVSFYVGMGFDGLLAAGTLLASSDHLRVATGVYLLPLRHPVTVARQLADLELLAPGRLTFGVGVGGEDPNEVAMCGVDPTTRGRRMDESLTVLRRLLAGETIDHDGEFFTMTNASIVPAPKEPTPILVGGRSDAAVRRAGRFGDGWHGIWVSAERFRAVVDQVAQHAADAGRPAPAHHALNVWCGIGNDHSQARERVAPAMSAFYQLPFEKFEKWSPAGTPADIAGFLEPYIEAGCREINLIAVGGSTEETITGCGEVRRLLVG